MDAAEIFSLLNAVDRSLYKKMRVDDVTQEDISEFQRLLKTCNEAILTFDVVIKRRIRAKIERIESKIACFLQRFKDSC